VRGYDSRERTRPRVLVPVRLGPAPRRTPLVTSRGGELRRGRRKQHARRVRSPDLSGFAVVPGRLPNWLVSAAEVIPPKPEGYFADYANVVSRDAALRFNQQLAQFETGHFQSDFGRRVPQKAKRFRCR